MARVGGSRSVAAAIAAALALSACGEGKPGGEAVILDAKAAMRAVFPEAVNGEVAIPASDDGPARIERPVTVIAGDERRVYLVTAKEQTEGCHACSASISVYYLQEINGALSLSAPYRDLYQSGGWGKPGEIKSLTLPRNGGVGMTDESGFTAQGCTALNVSAYRFDANGPKRILDRAPLARAQDDRIDVSGKIIKPYTADSDFTIAYSGNDNSAPIDTTVMWALDDGVLKQRSGEIPEAVAEGC